jgi:hypothetical protein
VVAEPLLQQPFARRQLLTRPGWSSREMHNWLAVDPTPCSLPALGWWGARWACFGFGGEPRAGGVLPRHELLRRRLVEEECLR